MKMIFKDTSLLQFVYFARDRDFIVSRGEGVKHVRVPKCNFSRFTSLLQLFDPHVLPLFGIYLLRFLSLFHCISLYVEKQRCQ
jgi:hypothetical protein